MAHICEIPELTQNTGHYGALFAKLIAAQKAFIEKLVTSDAFISRLATSEAFIDRLITKRLLVDSDTASPNNFELAINEGVGIQAKNNGEKVFEVTPAGNAFAKNAIFSDCVFSGDIYSGPLELSSVTPESSEVFFNAGTSIKDIDQTRGEFKIFCSSKPPHANIIEVSLKRDSYSRKETGQIFYYNSAGQIYASDTVPVTVNYYRASFYIIKTNGIETYFFISGGWSYPGSRFVYVSPRDNRNDNLPYNMVLLAKGGSKTLKLKDIPTISPKEKGLVWVSGDGVLHLS